MLTPETPRERLFCPHCGSDGAYDCTGEGDWVCRNAACAHSLDSKNPHPWITPWRERDLSAERDANARLIAAAPELRDYLAAFVGAIDRTRSNGHELVRLRLENEQLRLALAEALAAQRHGKP